MMCAPEPSERTTEDAMSDSLTQYAGRLTLPLIVMAPEPELRANRLGLLTDLRRSVGAIGDLSEIPLPGA